MWWERDGDGITAREGREKIEEGFCFGSGGRKRKAQVPEDSPTCYRERERERERERAGTDKRGRAIVRSTWAALV